MITNAMLARLIRRAMREPTRLKLYTAVRGESFIEARGGGYQDVLLLAADWTISKADPPHAESRVHQFIFDGSANYDVVGAYLTDDTSGDPLWSEVFKDGPFNIKRPGDIIPVRAILNMRGRTAQQRG
jgi:hypothetical protein